MTKEFFATAPTRNGCEFTAQLLGRLGIKTTYAGVEIYPYCDEDCRLDIHFNINHHLNRSNTKKGSVRIIRHPAAGFSSYYAWLKTLYLDANALPLRTALDSWLCCGAGPLLLSGYIEEYFFQNALLKESLGENAFFYFEKLKETPHELARLLHSMDINISFDRISAIHSAQLAEDATSSRNRSSTTNYGDAIAARLNMMANICNDNFGYIYNQSSATFPECSWPVNIFDDIVKQYRVFCRRRLLNSIYSINFTVLDNMLYNMCASLNNIPTFGIQFAGLGLIKTNHKSFCIEYLAEYVKSDDNPFLSVMALVFLSGRKEFGLMLRKKLELWDSGFNYSTHAPWFRPGDNLYTEMIPHMTSVILNYMK